MEKRNRAILLGLAITIIFVSMMILPALAYVDYDVEVTILEDETHGDWYASPHDAVEGGIFGLYALELVFQATGIDQTVDDYKIRIDYDGVDIHELLIIRYRWGTSGSWIQFAACGEYQSDSQYSISDPTSTTLQVQFHDWARILDFGRSTWEFGGEPELWLYWN